VFWLISARRLTFALRNRMTERTSHLAGLWIGAAISNTSYSSKAGSTTVKRHGLQVKGQGRRQSCHNKHKKFPYRPTRDVALLSGHALYFLKVSHTQHIRQDKIDNMFRWIKPSSDPF